MKSININKAKFEVDFENKIPRKGKAVICITTGEVFKSAKVAAEKYGLGYDSVTGCCRGAWSTVGGGAWNVYGNGLKFCYVADLAYRTKDIAEYISELKEKAERAEQFQAKIDAQIEKANEQIKLMKEMLRRHQEETAALITSMA